MVSGTLQTLALNPPAGGIPTSRSRISPTCAHGATLFARRLPVRLQPPPRLREVPHRISPVVRAAGGAYQVSGGSGGELSGDAKGGKLLSWARPLVDFASSNFLPLALVSGVALGFLNPTPGCLAHKYSISKFSAFGIFVISGLTLRSEDIGAAAEAWPAGLFGLASILLFTPFLSRLILQLQLSPQEFVTGLAIFCCMPTTLSSGITLTQLVRGNSALALALTVLSNLLGILLVPFSLSNFIGQGAGVSIPTMQLLKSLIMTLLVPLILGKVFRDSFGGVAEFVDQNRKLFSMTSAVFLSLVPWIQVSRSRSLLLAVQPTVFLAAVVMGITLNVGCIRDMGTYELFDQLWTIVFLCLLLHLILLAFNALALHSLSAVSGKSSSVFAKKENARAVILVASQKTLPVMVAVVEQLGGALGQSGLLVLPCVAAHINQIIIDSLLINKWLRSDLPSPKLKEA